MNLGCHMAQRCCPSLSALPDLSPKQKGFAERKDTVLPAGRMYLQVCICRELVCSRVSSKGVSVGRARSSLCSALKSQGRTQASFASPCHSLQNFLQTPNIPASLSGFIWRVERSISANLCPISYSLLPLTEQLQLMEEPASACPQMGGKKRHAEAEDKSRQWPWVEPLKRNDPDEHPEPLWSSMAWSPQPSSAFRGGTCFLLQ